MFIVSDFEGPFLNLNLSEWISATNGTLPVPNIIKMFLLKSIVKNGNMNF